MSASGLIAANASGGRIFREWGVFRGGKRVAAMASGLHPAEEMEFARLFAAAPELVAALDMAIATIERLATVHPGGFSSASGTLEICRQSLAKAKGGVQ